MAAILLVDDNRLVRLVIKDALERAGHLVLEASTGEAAKAHLDASTVDLGLFDHDLPDTTGVALLDEVRRRVGLRVPVIVMTACWTESGEAAAMRQGARYIEKPLELEDVVLVVEEALRQDSTTT